MGIQTFRGAEKTSRLDGLKKGGGEIKWKQKIN
jgi:hypothetical protein